MPQKSHRSELGRSQALHTCRMFSRGICSRGDECNFRHASKEDEEAEVEKVRRQNKASGESKKVREAQEAAQRVKMKTHEVAEASRLARRRKEMGELHRGNFPNSNYYEKEQGQEEDLALNSITEGKEESSPVPPTTWKEATLAIFNQICATSSTSPSSISTGDVSIQDIMVWAVSPNIANQLGAKSYKDIRQAFVACDRDRRGKLTQLQFHDGMTLLFGVVEEDDDDNLEDEEAKEEKAAISLVEAATRHEMSRSAPSSWGVSRSDMNEHVRYPHQQPTPRPVTSNNAGGYSSLTPQQPPHPPGLSGAPTRTMPPSMQTVQQSQAAAYAQYSSAAAASSTIHYQSQYQSQGQSQSLYQSQSQSQSQFSATLAPTQQQSTAAPPVAVNTYQHSSYSTPYTPALAPAQQQQPAPVPLAATYGQSASAASPSSVATPSQSQPQLQSLPPSSTPPPAAPQATPVTAPAPAPATAAVGGIDSDVASEAEMVSFFSQLMWLGDYDMSIYRWAGDQAEWTEFALVLRADVVVYIEATLDYLRGESGCEMSLEIERLKGANRKFLRLVRGKSGSPTNDCLDRAQVCLSRSLESYLIV